MDTAVKPRYDRQGVAAYPFFGAMYLSPLDRAFENRTGVFYVRFMDDITILAQTKSQFVAARKKLFCILRELQLKLSPSKTRMGKLHEGFHFLGIQFQVQPPVSRNPAAQTPVMVAAIHARSCRRALDQVRARQKSAVDQHPADTQRYLRRWAHWWARTLAPLTVASLLYDWRDYVEVFEPTSRWVAPSRYLTPNLWL